MYTWVCASSPRSLYAACVCVCIHVCLLTHAIVWVTFMDIYTCVARIDMSTWCRRPHLLPCVILVRFKLTITFAFCLAWTVASYSSLRPPWGVPMRSRPQWGLLMRLCDFRQHYCVAAGADSIQIRGTNSQYTWIANSPYIWVTNRMTPTMWTRVLTAAPCGGVAGVAGVHESYTRERDPWKGGVRNS